MVISRFGTYPLLVVLILLSSLMRCTSGFCRDPQEEQYGFAEGLGPVQIDGKWGFIDAKGAIAIAPSFDGVLAFSGGVAGVRIGNQLKFYHKRTRNSYKVFSY